MLLFTCCEITEDLEATLTTNKHLITLHGVCLVCLLQKLPQQQEIGPAAWRKQQPIRFSQHPSLFNHEPDSNLLLVIIIESKLYSISSRIFYFRHYFRLPHCKLSWEAKGSTSGPDWRRGSHTGWLVAGSLDHLGL